MAGGGSFISDQKFTTLTADGNFKTITGGSTNLGPCRVTYIQAHSGTNCLVKLHDGTGTGGSLEFQAKFSSEGLDIMMLMVILNTSLFITLNILIKMKES